MSKRWLGDGKRNRIVGKEGIGGSWVVVGFLIWKFEELGEMNYMLGKETGPS